jgi:hypothetical protein
MLERWHLAGFGVHQSPVQVFQLVRRGQEMSRPRHLLSELRYRKPWPFFDLRPHSCSQWASHDFGRIGQQIAPIGSAITKALTL